MGIELLCWRKGNRVCDFWRFCHHSSCCTALTMRCVLGPSFMWNMSDMYILHEAIILMLWTYFVDLHVFVSHATCHLWLAPNVSERTLYLGGVQTWDLFTVECFNHCHFKTNKEAFGSTWDLLGTGKNARLYITFGKNAHKLIKYYIEVWVNSYCLYCQNVFTHN